MMTISMTDLTEKYSFPIRSYSYRNHALLISPGIRTLSASCTCAFSRVQGYIYLLPGVCTALVTCIFRCSRNRTPEFRAVNFSVICLPWSGMCSTGGRLTYNFVRFALFGVFRDQPLVTNRCGKINAASGTPASRGLATGLENGIGAPRATLSMCGDQTPKHSLRFLFK